MQRLFIAAALCLTAAVASAQDSAIERAAVTVQLSADRAYAECAAEYERDARLGADRVFSHCEGTRRLIYAEAANGMLNELKNIVPKKCQDAVTSFEASFRDFGTAQQSFSKQITLARPGGGETDQATLDTVAAKSNYFYLKSLVSQIKEGMWFPICPL
jgi:hypothetical protein